MHSSSQFAPSGGLWSWLPSLWWTVSWRTFFALNSRAQRNEKHHFRLDDALLALDHVLQGVIELERDEQRHDLAEYVLEDLLVEGIEDAGQHADDDGRGEAIKRNQDDEADDERQSHGDRALEALVIRHHRPLRFQL